LNRDKRLAVVSVVLVCAMVTGGFGFRFLRDLPTPTSELVPGSASIFPSFPNLHSSFNVQLSRDTSPGMLLSLISLQGLVNRRGVQIYLDSGGWGNTSFLLPLLETKYNVTFTTISSEQFLTNFSSFATGLVVYDPPRPATINVATVDAGVDDRIIVGPDSLQTVSRLTGLNVGLDLRQPPWSGLSDIQLYRKSFQEFYPRCDRNLLAILPPSKTGLRDYLVAAKVWTFHVGQGPFSSQEEIDFTEDVLAATPRNIPILGWFEAPTITEENFLVQAASRHGKYILGGQDLPNLSFLTGMTPPGPFKQTRVVPPTEDPAEDGIYVSFAVPDGDNIDFILDRMRDMWNDETRGTVPIAWSINPLLASLAPPLLDYYYSNASALDSFVAAPSGAGYIYPGFARETDLKEYLVRAGRSMATADMDIVWLLNSFNARETPYKAETLDAYVAALRPRGVILDYSDQAATLDTWVQGGETAAAPVIRATHLWSGRDNVVGKIMADVDAAPSRAHFFLVTVYPWSLNLGEAAGALDVLRGRYGSRVEAVSVETLLALETREFLGQASRMLDAANGDVLTSLDRWDLEDASDLVGQARRESSGNETDLAAFHAYIAMQRVRRAMAVGLAILLSILTCAVMAVALLFWRAKQKVARDRQRLSRAWLYPGLASALLFYIFFGGLQKALDYYFWTYASVFVAGALLIFVPRIQARLQSLVGDDSWLVEVGVLSLSGIFLLREPWAFVPFACAGAMLMARFMRRGDYSRDAAALFLGAGLVGSVVFPFDWPGLVVCAVVLIAVSFHLRPTAPSIQIVKDERRTPGVNFAATTLALVAVWLTPFQNRYFVEKADGGLGLLLALSTFALLAAPIVVLALWKTMGTLGRTGGIISLTATTGLWIAVWALQSATLSAVVLMALAVLICWSHLSASSRVRWTSAATGKFVSSLLILGTIVVIFVRMPAIVYSLYITRLPLAVEYILYTPPLLMIFATLDLVQTEILFRAGRKGTPDEAKAAGSGENE